ncbi:GNAT family N-acetyltransferase [Limosilactobacillus reuteri]|uniref:GNAT family N-acetyltransferase n=1 Tax=Limosilactobacillus reuteri TaxID=1598 RepID=UPI0021D1ED06|nr:GNAT family N-acetyltransferase [Limosilactobacillus reuteri]MCU4691316.1 GNAT family N-acetyltransferase [Limosilactobacillus reuteri]
MWESKTFQQLTTSELFKIYYLRGRVFVAEQQRALNDVDQHDLQAIHVMNFVNEELICYARIFTENDHVTFGRVVIAPEFRGQGHGTTLLQKIMATIKEYFPGNKIEI